MYQLGRTHSGVISWTVALPRAAKVYTFSYLPLRDRENVRLVCKDWNRASWSRKLIINDWVILSSDQFSSIDEKMDQMCDVFSARVGDNKPTSFRIIFPELSHPADDRFWTIFGPHVAHLQLRNAGPDSLRLILERCTSLRTLDFVDHSFARLPDPISEASLATIRDNLRGLRELCCGGSFPYFDTDSDIRSKYRLRSLRYSASTNLDEQELSEFFAKCQPGNISLMVESHEPEDSFSSESGKELRNLLLNYHLALTDFQFIALNQTSVPLAQCVFENIPVHSKTLTKLNLTLQQDVGVYVFFLILQSVNGLSRLEECKLVLPPTIVTAFVYSVLSNNPGLKVLSVERMILGSNSVRWDWPSEQFVEGLSGGSLRSLRIEGFTVGGFLFNNNNKLATFAKALTSLTLSEVDDLDNAVVQQICKECTNLRSLAIENCPELTDAGLSRRVAILLATPARSRERYGLANLKLLVTLKLIGDHFGAATVTELRFPGLRALNLTLQSLSDDDLLLIARNNPHLETFHTTHGDGPKWVGSVRFLEMSPLTWAGVVRFLELCPRLTSLYIAAPEDEHGAVQEDDDSTEYFTDAQMRTVRKKFPKLKRLNKNRLLGD